MELRLRALTAAILLGAATVDVTAIQRLVPYLPPPDGMNAYDILDLGPAPAVSCSCVPNPFALPTYRPGWGYGSGPAVPAGNAPITETQRDINRAWYEQEEEVMRQVSDDALANNNPHASLAVAMHLSTRKAIFGDDRSEGDVVRWLTFAAEQGHPDASRMLADRYAHGRGVPQDHAMAAFWFDQGARRDDPISMTALGFLLAAGRGVAQNWPAAIRWWQRAEARAPVASRYLGDAYACGAGVDEDHTRAVAAYKRFADRDASSTIQLGYLYLRGCAPADDKAPVEAFRRAADQGYPEAQVELSALLREGRGTEVNPNEAYYWARLAERRLESGDLKHRAEGSAAAAARTMSSLEIAASDDMVKSMIAACAKPMR